VEHLKGAFTWECTLGQAPALTEYIWPATNPTKLFSGVSYDHISVALVKMFRKYALSYFTPRSFLLIVDPG
jgi:hypothetical protein